MSEKIKRYVCFTCSDYYPCGGWRDFSGSFDSLDEAREAVKGNHDDKQIIDLETGEDVIND